jgi:ankyrin repeat protein
VEYLNRLDDNGNAPIHCACQGHSILVICRLIAAGIDVNIRVLDGQTPMMNTAHRGDIHYSLALLEVENIDVNLADKRGRTALHSAAKSPRVGSCEVLRVLLSEGANISQRTQEMTRLCTIWRLPLPHKIPPKNYLRGCNYSCRAELS